MRVRDESSVSGRVLRLMMESRRPLLLDEICLGATGKNEEKERNHVRVVLHRLSDAGVVTKHEARYTFKKRMPPSEKNQERAVSVEHVPPEGPRRVLQIVPRQIIFANQWILEAYDVHTKRWMSLPLRELQNWQSTDDLESGCTPPIEEPHKIEGLPS